MTEINLLTRDDVLYRMLWLVLEGKGVNVINECAIPSGGIGIVDARCMHEVILPADKKADIIVLGYPEELLSRDIPSGAVKVERPFSVKDLLFLLFGDSTSSSPEIKHRGVSDMLVLDKVTRSVTLGDVSAKLSKREYALFTFLYENRGREMQRKEIYDSVWNGQGHENVVDVYICYLREKTEKRFGVKLITTSRGNGYGMVK